jgi:hypothetical protein
MLVQAVAKYAQVLLARCIAAVSPIAISANACPRFGNCTVHVSSDLPRLLGLGSRRRLGLYRIRFTAEVPALCTNRRICLLPGSSCFQSMCLSPSVTFRQLWACSSCSPEARTRPSPVSRSSKEGKVLWFKSFCSERNER